MVKRKKKPKGWTGDSYGHSLARRGIKSHTPSKFSPKPVQSLEPGVLASISKVRHLKAMRREALRNKELEAAGILNAQIKIQEAYLLRVLKANQLELMEAGQR
jgi:hypothetical protein